MARQAGKCTVGALPLDVLTWNLFHGRAVPSAGRPLLREFATALAGWEWDVAVLQEVPPWWPPALAGACGAAQRTALTSRNACAGTRRAIASRRPDLLKAAGGGANVILVRGPVGPHARRRLRAWPERRVVHATELPDGTWIANLHASTRPPARVRADVARAGGTLRRWARGAPAVLAGDFNLRDPRVPGFVPAAAHEVDHVLADGLEPDGPAETVDVTGLSDHSPLRVRLSLSARSPRPPPAGRSRAA